MQEHVSNPTPDEEPGEIETPEALLNDVILQNIFKYLGYKDLKSCREVGNKTWLRNSKKAWWSRTKVVFKRNHKLQDTLANYLNQSTITSNATNYKFPVVNVNLKHFWETLGHSIKYLEISNGHFQSVDDFRQLIYTQCPNVEKLVVDNISVKSGDIDITELMRSQKLRKFRKQRKLKYLESDYSRLPLSWMELLSHFPNLQALKVRVDNDDIYKVISIIRQHNPGKLKLNHIDIRGLPWYRHYDKSLSRVSLDPKLSFKTIYIWLDNLQVKTVEDILQLHANSLEELSISAVHESTQILKKISIPEPIKKLEKLTIHDCLFTADIFKYIPSVRRVELNYHGPSYNLLQEAEPNLIINTCKELTLHIYCYSNESTSDLVFFMSVFPNIEIFQTGGLNNLEFSMICKRWKKLRSLNVFKNSQVDEVGLLGYDPDSNGIRRPNITDLKDLQSFSMESVMSLKMENGSVILKELEGLRHLKKFELKDYQFKGESIWEEIFAKYSRE